MATAMDNLHDADGKSIENNESYKVESTTEENLQPIIPAKDYDKLSLDLILDEAKHLLKTYPVQELREHFLQIREAATSKLALEAAEKREQFLADGGNELDFRFDSPLKRDFYLIYNDYKKQLAAYYEENEKQERHNLEIRKAIVEELKALYQDPNEQNSLLFKKFRDLKTRWHNAGRIPASEANNIFKTYYFHLDNFYKYLDLNKELREMDMNHNLEVRHSIIKRAEELVGEENVQKALNELQYLHRLWKEEAVPVQEEHREPTWNRFKELTNKIHDRKAELNEMIKKTQEDNYARKLAIIDEIAEIAKKDEQSHNEWQIAIKRINGLREEFLKIGRVPKNVNNEVWDKFKQTTKEFNHKKNSFYKNMKNEQDINLKKKLELIEIARQHSESTDWNNSVKVIKRIQNEWKNIGHVPRKQSDRVWKEFKLLCNNFFDRYKKRNEEETAKFEQNLAAKNQIIAQLKTLASVNDTTKDIEALIALEKKFNAIGKVPAKKMNIATAFQKELERKVQEFGIADEALQDYRLNSIFEKAKSENNADLIDNEIIRTRKLIEELEKEVNQLENNISFFNDTDENNPLLKNVYQQLGEKKSKLADLEQKLKKLYQYNSNEAQQEEQSTEE
ncbi:DUF349 domain-containing protein [Vaginella massiliensis]|uniref:DUF349 domain-containing protein n=1 Tax=Vaginella massiliensis TaxID=1816680 RepID=UPI00083939A4|nr:DUF349 domain-containing protein [Vaginella massiliensis]